MSTKVMNIIKNRNIWAVLAILCLAFLIRINTFWIPHWQGDQSQYLSLALKLDTFGFTEYNLRGINIQYFSPKGDTDICIIFPVIAKDKDSTGVILTALEGAGGRRYDTPLYHLPPAFPYAIMLSHKIFTQKNTPYLSIESNKKITRNHVLFKTQFYSVIVPLFFDIGMILCTFFIGKTLYNNRVGLYASLMLTLNAVNILSSQRLWADTMLSFFVTLSILLFVLSMNQKRQLLFIFLSGISAGIAILCKQTAGFYVFAIISFIIITNEKWYTLLTGLIIALLTGSFITKEPFFFFMLDNTSFLLFFYVISFFRIKEEKDVFNLKNIRYVFDKKLLVFVIPIILVTGFWFLSMFTQTGDALFLPKQSANKFILTKDIKLWNNILFERPEGRFLYFIGIPIIFPLFFFAYISIKDFLYNLIQTLTKKNSDHRFIILWLIILFFFYNLGNNREHRLMLPTYSCFAILSAYMLDKFQCWSGKFSSQIIVSQKSRTLIVWIFFIICAIWSIKIGLQTTLSNALLIKVPF
ncbi:MAG: glycosyltransferase family 39 protein [Candidatus Omnitrophica bacterium]|nr:glycosyltransferase family 39 protein [Candidatus Omnitrophota bacterium]